MPENERKTIIDRANRILKQSRLLRKMSDELKLESHDLLRSTKGMGMGKSKRPRAKRPRG